MPVRLTPFVTSSIAGGIVVAGFLAGIWSYRVTRDRITAEAALSAARSAVAFETGELTRLTAARPDLGTREYGILRRRLDRLVAADPQVHAVRLLRYFPERNKLLLLAAAAHPTVGEVPLPGDIFDPLLDSEPLQVTALTGAATAAGPLERPSGSWMRGYALVGELPVEAGEPRDLLVLGFAPGEWRAELWLSSAAAAFGVWFVLGLPLAGVAAFRRQREQGEIIRNLSEAMEQAHSALMIVDLGGRIEYVNAGLCAQIGYHRRELIGVPWREFQQERTAPEVTADMVTTVRSGRSWTGEWFNRRRDGTVYPVRGVVSPVLRRDGGLACFVAVFDDVTELKRTERVLREARDRAEAGDRAKGLFLATMSHEVRTPLNGIVGFSALLLETRLSAEQQEYVETIRTSSEALIQLTGDILDYARIESGRLKLEPQLCDPRDCIEDAFDLLATKAAEKKVELLHEVVDGVPALILADGGRLRQVLVNLVNNGVKFTAAGEVAVRLTAVARTADTVTLALAVRDTGIGIAPEDQGKLFKPFTQVEATTTRRFDGSGLGLAICKNLVELMRGEISLVSALGQGSTFTVTLTVPVPADELPPRPAPPRLTGLRVALAVGPEGLRRELHRLVASWGATPLPLPWTELAAKAAAWDVALVEADEALVEKGAEQLWPLAGVAADRLIGVVPISLAGAQRAGLRPHFRLLLNKPVHHATLHSLLAQPLAPAAPTIVSANPLLGLDVLIVEDNPVNQRLAQKLVASLGCRSGSAENGRLALEALQQRRYDLVLMDLHMPEMDGLTAITTIRGGAIAAIPRGIWIIALTADVRSDQKDRVLAAGANDYLTKPVRLPELAAALQRVVGQRRAG